jgi:hypothetical protein
VLWNKIILVSGRESLNISCVLLCCGCVLVQVYPYYDVFSQLLTIRGERGNCTHLILNCYRMSFIEFSQILLVKNKKHAQRTIIHLCGAMECKNGMAETDYRFQKFTA